MRIVVQRVKGAEVKVDGKVMGKIGRGVLVFFAVHKNDTPEKTMWLVQKLIHLRMFPDESGKMNISLEELKGDVLIVSQFTLYGNCIEGRRPDFVEAAPANIAQPIYEKFVEEVRHQHLKVETGVFAAKMEVSLVNDGPVTFIIDAPHGPC